MTQCVLLEDIVLRVAQIVPFTEAEGPGVRFALWLQGCPLRCPGCCNPEMLPFEGGTPMRVAEVLSQVEGAARDHGVEGITLGGLRRNSWKYAVVALRAASRSRSACRARF